MTRFGDRVPARLVLLVLMMSLSACGTALAPSPLEQRGDLQAPGNALVRSELLFGRARLDGRLVSAEEWAAFVDNYVTPRFPKGLTILDAVGQYRTRSGKLIREPSKVVILLHEADAKSRTSIREIRVAYKRRFNQESVLLITSLARVSF